MNNINLTLSMLLLLNIFSVAITLNFRNKLNQAMSKAKSIYKNKFGKDKSWHFLGHDASEYPGTNEEMRRIQQDKWEEYYECLIKQENNIGKHGSIIPEAVQAFDGESIKFECKVCISPAETNDIESVEWDWGHVDAQYLEAVEYTDHVLLSPEDKTLHLYNVGPENMGQYVCKLGEQLTAPYFLTVVSNSEPMTMVHPKKAPNGPYKQPIWKIHFNMILDTMWSAWTPCSTCDVVGKRHKYGYCIIIFLSNLEHNETEEISHNKEGDIYEEDTENVDFIDMTRNTTINLSEGDRELLQMFKYGIPCRSHILSSSIKNVPVIHDRKSEIMTGLCKVKCPVEEVFVVKDKSGNVIETANNSDGIYSMTQGLPSVEPPVERRLQYEAAAKDIVLTCPGNLNMDTPILWQIGGKNVVPSLLSKESNGRMFVSITDRIHIKQSKLLDSNIYSCWQEKKLAGTIRLVVEKRINLNFNHHIMLIGIIIILSTFIYVFIKAFTGRKFVTISI